VPPNLPGVKDGVGANNIGSLVRIAGKVTYRFTYYLYVDDGSNVPDTPGRIGVMVKCPSTSVPASVGDTVVVTGLVEGSVPTGWTANRRYIHIRGLGDLVKV